MFGFNSVTRFLTLLLFIFSFNLFAQNGIIKSYYGPKKLRAKLSYTNDVFDGTSFWYYENGNLKAEKNYSNGKLHGYVREYYENGLLREEFFVREGIRDGHNRIYWENGALKELRTYEFGKLIKRVEIDYDPLYVAPAEAFNAASSMAIKEANDEFICNADICPAPIGGIKAIQEKLIYPEHARLYGLEGSVTVVATINEEGFVEYANAVKGIGLGCDEAAEDAVISTRFLPGQTNGVPVVSQITLYVEFNIDKQKILSQNTSPVDRNLDVQEPEIQNNITDDEAKDDYPKVITETVQYETDKVLTELVDEEKEPESKQIEYYPIDEENSTEVELPKISRQNVIETPQDSISHMQVTEEVYENLSCEVEICAQPVGGMAELMNNFQVPRSVKKLSIKGNVVLKADIDKYGNVRNTEVLKGLGHGCDIAAEVAVLDTRFVAGEIDGKRIRSHVIIVIPVR